MKFRDIDFKTVEKRFRPHPFWSLNDRLNEEETARQVRLMNDEGIGGFFMHARGGLEDTYMGETWFANIKAASDTGNALSMLPFAYDENGWPSGFASGEVPKLGRQYTLKMLLCEKGKAHKETTVANVDGYHFYYIEGQNAEDASYVDLLSPCVTEAFLRLAYEPYYEKFGAGLAGFFTDEPQLCRMDGALPWSFVLPEAYEKAYGTPLLPLLPALFFDREGADEVRIRFFSLVGRLFRDNFSEKVGAWCRAHGYRFTGHYLLEEDFARQIRANGDLMLQYPAMDMPGIDMLTRAMHAPQGGIAAYQVASMAHQAGKRQILTESFAASGHDVSFDDLMGMFRHQAVRGVTLVCQHLSPYSMRGLRKRDYPPCLSFQQPWHEVYSAFNDTAARLGMLLSEGDACFDTLLLHPLISCFAAFKGGDTAGVAHLQAQFTEALRSLEEKHLLFDLGDELYMEEHAKIEDGVLRVGEGRYKRVLLPDHTHLLPSTRALLSAFAACGGQVLSYKEAPTDPMPLPKEITYTKRTFEDSTFYYLLNESDHPVTVPCSFGNVLLNLQTGDLSGAPETVTLAPGSDLALFDAPVSLPKPLAPQSKALDIKGTWEVAACTDNALTLDTCDCTFDGELVAEGDYILNVLSRAIALGRDVDAQLHFHFAVESVPERLFLALEEPQRFSAVLNGEALPLVPCGTFFDPSVALIDIASFVKTGDNRLSLSIHIHPGVNDIGRSNVLRYDTEIEAIYLVGAFGVRSQSAFESLPCDAVRTSGPFVLTERPKAVTLSHIEQQGFPFFPGKMTLRRPVKKGDGTLLKLSLFGVNAVDVALDGRAAARLCYAPLTVDLAPFFTDDEGVLSLTFYTNLRNLLGPHHLPSGETYCAAPNRFYAMENPFGKSDFDGRYCLVETSLSPSLDGASDN